MVTTPYGSVTSVSPSSVFDPFELPLEGQPIMIRPTYHAAGIPSMVSFTVFPPLTAKENIKDIFRPSPVT